MNIDFFREKFVDTAKELTDDNMPAVTIELDHCESWDKARSAMVTKVTKNDNKMTLHLTEEYIPKSFYKFTDMDVFSDVDEVVFELNDKEIDQFELVDLGVSDRVFVFETDFRKYGV